MAAVQTVKKSTNKQNTRRNIWLLTFTFLLVVGSIFMFMPPQEKINQGLDIQGGLSVVLEAKSTAGQAVTAEDMERSRAIIESRVNALGASETVVQVQGTNQILVQIPGLADTERALSTIGKTGKLEFARLDSFTDEEVKKKIDEGNIVSAPETIEDELLKVNLPKGDVVRLKVEEGTYEPMITGANINSVNVGRANDLGLEYSVNLNLNAAGAQSFRQVSTELAPTKGKIVIILDGEIQSAPAVQSVIPNGEVSITGGYDYDGAHDLQTILESGSLPISFEYKQSQVVGPTLGQQALQSGVLVAAIGLLLVMLYLLFFYRGLGMVAAGAMAVFAIIYLGILATLSALGLFSLSLAGIAGIVLTIGMAADSSILTMERFREEIRMGRSVRAASITGVRHAIKTSIDADLVTLVSALALFFLASASVKGFGMTLALGIFCDIVMMLTFKAPLIRLLANRIIPKAPTFWGIKKSLAAAGVDATALAAATTAGTGATAGAGALAASADAVLENKNEEASTKAAKKSSRDEVVTTGKPEDRPSQNRFLKWDINFIGKRKIFLGIAIVLVTASIATVAIKELNLGIEFVGGTSITFRETGDVDTEEMRKAFAEAGEPNAVIQTTNTDGESGFLVRTTANDVAAADASARQIAEKFNLSAENYEVMTIHPDWGVGVIKASLLAFLASVILIIIYIAIRFEYKMGLMAIVSVFHVLILVIGIYALSGREVNPNTVAALLTILGYSLYDSVVVFHRINDNMKETEFKCTFLTMANHSVNQVIVRTMNTTLSSLIPILAMLIFGGETLRDFAFAIAIGLVCGSYSSIAIAVPLYSMWKSSEKKNKKLTKKYGKKIGLYEFAHPNLQFARLKGETTGDSVVLADAIATVPVEASSGKAGTKSGAKAEPKKDNKSNHHYRRKKK